MSVDPSLVTEYYPLPRVDEIFANVKGCSVFSVLDLKSAYLQLALDKRSQGVLTVNTHLGWFQFTRLPYGVASAPVIFQGVMDAVLQGLDKTACYLDDVLVGSVDLDDCVNRVEEVLERFAKCGLRINEEKCKLFCD